MAGSKDPKDSKEKETKDIKDTRPEPSSTLKPRPRGASKSDDITATTRRRSVSGSVFARFPFLRSPTEESPPSLPLPKSPTQPASPPTHNHTEAEPHPQSSSHTSNASPRPSSAMAALMQQTKGRRRKGSLRKTAILGTGKLHLDTRAGSTTGSSTSSASASRPLDIFLRSPPPVRDSMDSQRTITSSITTNSTTVQSPSKPAAARFSLDLASASSSTESFPSLEKKSSVETDESLSLSMLDGADADAHDDAFRHHTGHHPSNSSSNSGGFKLETPASSPTGTYASTDDDEVLSLPSTSPPPTDTVSSLLSKQPSVSSSSTSSYFAVPDHIPPRLRASTLNKSPLSSLPDYALLHVADEEWDYTSTARWGWVVLVATWIVFVVGMGSCFSVWSWAWDVGETPYAPPELEDDPTLPIVGYYPALLVLTGVMSWVWVVAAWVGMKYFKHAKMAGEGG